jgi:spore coat polysaccharide biosynthesis protein SpsF
MVDGLQNKKIAFIIQARMGSTRLPGKILMPLPLETDKCLLNWIIDSLKKSSFNNTIFIATSLNSINDPLEGFCKENAVECYRGSEEDVLSRFIDITKTNEFDHVVRLTGDNPFVDINLLDKSISHHLSSEADYTATSGLPLGMNFEIICANALQGLDKIELSVSEREHVTLYIKNSEGYKRNTFYPLVKDLSNLRLTVDYSSDYLVVSTILSIAEKRKVSPGLDLIIYCLKQYPWIFKLNQKNIQKTIYKNIQEEIEIAKPILDKYGFEKLISFIDENE